MVDGEHDATYAERVRRCVRRLSADGRRLEELHQLEPAVAVRGPIARWHGPQMHKLKLTMVS
jgi:hypothetical protein